MNKILLMLLDHKIGDMIVVSFFIRELKKLYPSAQLDILAISPYSTLLHHNPHVSHIYTLPANKYKKILYILIRTFALRKQKYDLVITQNRSNKRKLLSSFLASKQIIPITPIPAVHITQWYSSILKQLGAKEINTTYELFLPDQSLKKASVWLKQNRTNKPILIFNPLASERIRSLSLSKTTDILKEVNKLNKYEIFLLDYNNQYSNLQDLALIIPEKDIFTVAALIQKAHIVISVDTGIVHIADIYRKPIIDIFPHSNIQGHYTRWSPLSLHRLLISSSTLDHIHTQDVISAIEELENTISGSSSNTLS